MIVFVFDCALLGLLLFVFMSYVMFVCWLACVCLCLRWLMCCVVCFAWLRASCACCLACACLCVVAPGCLYVF